MNICITGFVLTLGFISGILTLVVLGVVVLAIMFSIMVVNWAKLTFNQEVQEIAVLVFLILLNGFGLVCVCLLGLFYSKSTVDENSSSHKRDSKKLHFPEKKLLAIYFFGFGYLFHCGLFAWRHSYSNSAKHILGFIFNILTIIYVCCLFIFFSLYFDKRYKKNCKNNVLIFGILISNIGIWLDALFSEANDLFKANIVNNDTLTLQNIYHSFSKADEIIHKTDPFLSPAIIEFSLMVIDIFFSSKTKNQKDESGYSVWKIIIPISSISSFALFSFTFTVLLMNFIHVDYPNGFLVYVIMQIVLKIAMFIILIYILFGFIRYVNDEVIFHFNVSAFVLIISCFGNIVYHMLYLVASFSKTDFLLPFCVIDNSVSLFIAGIQTYFLLGIHSLKKSLPNVKSLNECKRHMYNACYVLSIINFGLWGSDSIGESRYPLFSIILYKAYGKTVWKFINKLIFPLTIFFRFHAGMDFLDLFWEKSLLESK